MLDMSSKKDIIMISFFTPSILNDYPLVFIGNKNVEGNSTGRYTNFYNTCCYDNKNNKVISKEEMSIQKKLNELQN